MEEQQQQLRSNCFIRLMISKSALPRRTIIECEVIILSAVARPIYCLYHRTVCVCDSEGGSSSRQ